MPNVTDFYVRFIIAGDDKDGGEAVSAEVLKESLTESHVVARHNVFAKPEHEWDDGDPVPLPTDDEFGGKAGWFRLDDPGIIEPVSKADRPNLKLRISKSGDNGWQFRPFCLVVLDDDTEEVWLDGADFVRTLHKGSTDLPLSGDILKKVEEDVEPPYPKDA